eukprot:8362576-Karenia_brevis.AAC.1
MAVTAFPAEMKAIEKFNGREESRVEDKVGDADAHTYRHVIPTRKYWIREPERLEKVSRLENAIDFNCTRHSKCPDACISASKHFRCPDRERTN